MLTLQITRRRFVVPALMALSLTLSGVARSEAADPREDGPLGLVTTLQVAPANRAQLRRLTLDAVIPRLEQFQREGRVQDYRVLFSRYADSEGFDLLVQLSFARYSDVERWKDVEMRHPAGLPDAALRLVKTMATVPVDRMRAGEAREAAKQPTYLVIPYDYLVSTNEYLKYLDGYVVPQLGGWIDEGIVSGYDLYFGRYAAGRPWSAMLMVEYRDDAALGRRDAVVKKVRARLNEIPQWRAIAENKEKIRVERAPVIADRLGQPKPSRP